MKLKITATGFRGCGKSHLIMALLQAGVNAGVLPEEALNVEPENIKGRGAKLRERVALELPDTVIDGKIS